ncbi:uncharacterized protein PG998_004264 [Apiospora kogelbergensis]|uniref:uncharacterized protein n=1 Tax=Apiospora kogelbergensis TaxID=1337665 RepID=UPI0031317972
MAIEHFADDSGDETSSTRAKLAALIVELSKIELRDDSGDIILSHEGKKEFWSELPGWVLSFCDLLTGLPDRGSLLDETGFMVGWQRRFQGGNLFQAHWLAHVGPVAGPPLAYRYAIAQGLEYMREALETKPEESPLGRRHSERYTAGVLPWIWEAGVKVLELCRAEHRRDGSKVFSRTHSCEGFTGYTFTGDDGYHMERWGVWKGAYRRVAATQGIRPEVAERAAATAEEMDRLELEYE